jgi:NitT/TauT family transport system substrate-binding protein
MMHTSRRLLLGLAASALLMATASVPPAAAAGKIRIAFGDVATVETLNFLIAVERARERGVDTTVTYFKSEDIAAQAVVGGQADVGVGAPYTVLQKVKAPIRIFYQMSTLRFFPVVNTEFYQDWKDLDGQEIAVHSRGSGTEAIMQLMAKRQGINYGNISYVPGSEVRATALLQGHVKASIVDSTNWRIIQEKGGDKFKLLAIEDVDATDEALYANTEFLEREQEAVDILVEELVRTWREINANPGVVAELRTKYNLLPDMPAELVADIGPYYEGSVASGAFPNDGGGAKAAKADFEFNALAGKLEGDPSTLVVEDFWELGPLNRALAKLGQG